MLPTLDDLRHYIQTTILNHSTDPIEDDQDLLLSGLLDSLNVIRLVTWLEQSCGIAIPPEDVLVEHFGSLNQIIDYLSKRTD